MVIGISAYLVLDTGDTSAYFDGAMCVEGESAFAFSPKPLEGPNALAEINNDWTGHGLYIHQDGVLAAANYGLYVYSDAVQINSTLLYIKQDNASSTSAVGWIANDGTGHCLSVDQNGVLAANQDAIKIYSNVAQVTSELFAIIQDHASSSYVTATIRDDGTGGCLNLNQVGNGPCLRINDDGTGHAIHVTTDGNLASAQYALYIDNNGTPADGATFCLRFDGCAVTGTAAAVFTANKGITSHTALVGWLSVNIDGTARYIPYW